MSQWTDGLWDTTDVEAQQHRERLVTARVATASIWPFLAQSADREDFANRLELRRASLEAACGGDEDFLRQVEGAFANDFEVVLAARPAPVVKEAVRTPAPVAPQPLPQVEAGWHTVGTMTDLSPIEIRASVNNNCDHCHGPIYAGERYVYDPMEGTRKCGSCSPRQEGMRRAAGLACSNCQRVSKTASLDESSFCEHCGFLKEAAPKCDICGRRYSDYDAHMNNFHPDAEDLPEGPKYNQPELKNNYTHWGDYDDEGNAVGTGTGRSKRKKTATATQEHDDHSEQRVASLSAEEVEEARQERKIARGESRFSDEYDAGLECTHPGCGDLFYTTAARNEHVASVHAPPPPPAAPARRGLRQRVSAAVRRTAETKDKEDNLKKTCPICGKSIPASEMKKHMEKEHPHQATKPEDDERAETADEHEAETKERKEKHRPPERRERKEGAANPFSTSNNPFVPDTSGGTVSPTQDAMSSPLSAPPGVDTAAMSPVQDMNTPPNMNPRSAHKVAMMITDLKHLNPGISDEQALRLATATLQRYPQIAKEALGGADYVDGETLTTCPQCQKDAFSPATHRCHFCGYLQAA